LLRLSSHQATLLSSIWAQAISPKNTPKNYEAIAHTYSLLLLFLGSKVLSFYKLHLLSVLLVMGLAKTF
jgi:protein EFR3